ncbi:uncharacterized protein Z518_00562 [Rhinocladiella mackenziei CBS 650.93]|uniref:Uncharacterized protein n=1 Tax=Rhinocladiella mackenziei CBS 650.93 TaxID=1442369 RepID=A0A0D2G4A6_9EURO|nr:uncharacterized protein Z518_00562 [Rhinocladiella mackenziei CBS 650.93]KIX09482.1 hypothetical protein Z518_00562 [Rhinocladiella mackenziei CBS 650.93]
MIEISVGQVSAVIAAVITVLQLFLPTALALLIVGVLKDDMTAVSWSSISATLHGSHWAALLRADTATSFNVQGSIRWLTHVGSLTLLIIFAASIVTPIGLYDTVEPASTLQDVSFPYIADTGPFGFGTPARSTLGFNHQCGIPYWTACPGSDTIEVKSDEFLSSDFPYGYDSRIPSDKIELFQSGLKEQMQTVSSFFDIQYRSHGKAQDPDVNNGSFYQTGSYRQLGTLVLDDKVEAVEGLVVDMINGSVAFRNHTLPANLALGATWSEDLLVMEPETHCVDTNLTIDFTISGLNGSLGGNIENIVLTDRGGFANIPHTFPEYDNSLPQIFVDLPNRAYQSAWLFNVLLAIYYNVTRPNPDKFAYLNSEVGKTFELPETTLLATDELAIATYDDVFSTFLANDNSSFTSDDSFDPWPNPFNITSSNFTDILTACNGVSPASKSNMSNVAVGCGLVYGIPRLPDGEVKLVYDPGSRLSMPLQSCATAVKMSVKTYSFRFNGTSSLQSLHVDSINERSPDSPPTYWGIENNSDLDLNIQDTPPLWGLVSSDTKESPSLSVVKNPHLYLAGYLGSFAMLTSTGVDNMPGLTFPIDALASLYNGDAFDTYNSFGWYSGKSSFSMFALWQKLATRGETARIVNLIFADLAANGLVGTKSWLPSPNTIPGTDGKVQKRQSSSGGGGDTAQVPVVVYSRQIKYNWVYGVPAYIGIFFTAVIGLATLIFLCLGRTSLSKMKAYLHATSSGRILAAFLYPGESEPQAPTRSWVRGAGGKKIRIGKPNWIPHATQPTLYPEKTSHTAYPGAQGGGLAGYESDADPLIDQKIGTAIQLTPLSSPMPPAQQGFGTTGVQENKHEYGGYQPHQGYLAQFGGNHVAGQMPSPQVQTQFAPPPTHPSGRYHVNRF